MRKTRRNKQAGYKYKTKKKGDGMMRHKFGKLDKVCVPSLTEILPQHLIGGTPVPWAGTNIGRGNFGKPEAGKQMKITMSRAVTKCSLVDCYEHLGKTVAALVPQNVGNGLQDCMQCASNTGDSYYFN
jgi:hypothetical protein